MGDENKVNYYAIIPATVRYSKELKANEKLLYGEITSLSNKNGYCYAQNRYFADLYNVSIETVSRWLSHLQELGFIKIEIKRNEKKEIITRNIYIVDVPYCQNNQEGIDEKVKDNNIKYSIDDLFYYIINKSSKFSKDFYKTIEKLEFNYTEEMLFMLNEDNLQMLKNIIYVLYELHNTKFDFLLSKVSRESLSNLYKISLEHKPKDLLSYYKRAVINKYNDSS